MLLKQKKVVEVFIVVKSCTNPFNKFYRATVKVSLKILNSKKT